jgi:hypothetical protein
MLVKSPINSLRVERRPGGLHVRAQFRDKVQLLSSPSDHWKGLQKNFDDFRVEYVRLGDNIESTGEIDRGCDGDLGVRCRDTESEFHCADDLNKVLLD